MFGSVGVPELIIIFTIALIIFGPRKLPELGKSLGKIKTKQSVCEWKHQIQMVTGIGVVRGCRDTQLAR